MKVPKRTQLDIDREVQRYLEPINELCDYPWTSDEIANGRWVPLDTVDERVVAQLRMAYFLVGHHVYGVKQHGAFFLEFRYERQ